MVPKSDLRNKKLPQLYPELNKTNLHGLTLYELYRRQERNNHNIHLLESWLGEYEYPVNQDPMTYGIWKEFMRLRKKLIWAIRLKRLKLRLNTWIIEGIWK